MTLLQAITVCKEMQMWRISEPPYDRPETMPYTPDCFGEAIDVLIDLAERQYEMEEDQMRFLQRLKEMSEE